MRIMFFYFDRFSTFWAFYVLFTQPTYIEEVRLDK